MFRSQIIAVHDFYSIYKATIFNAEQIILGIEASRLVESSIRSQLAGIEPIVGTLLRYLDLCIKCISVSLADNVVDDTLSFLSTIRERRSKTHEGEERG